MNYYCINTTLADSTYDDEYTGITGVNVTVSACNYGAALRSGFLALSLMVLSVFF